DSDRMGIEIVPPNVNHSDVSFAVADGKIIFALSAIKGCGGNTAIAIATERKENGRFKDIFDFCERVDPSACNRSSIETLIKAGAMDGFAEHRAQLLAVVERAMQAGANAIKDKRTGQGSLFGGFDDDDNQEEEPAVKLPEVPEWPSKEELMFEKEVLGFYIDSHPLAEYEPKLGAFRTHSSDELGELKRRAEVMLGGMISSIKFSHTKNGKPGTPTKYANFDLEDMKGGIRCIMWPRQFVDHGEAVVPDGVVIARGTVEKRGGGDEVNLIVDELIPLSELDSRYTRGIRLHLDEARHGEATLESIREIVRGYPGRQDLLISMRLDGGEIVQMKSQKYRVEVTPELRQRLDDLLGGGSYKLLMTKPKLSAGHDGWKK
ncbi:MAG: OB-fold nucleic acid binding domain-containing protein, partial [Planctomycetota bacterium]